VPERYEDVRRKLVERGYLHGPVERFLLRDLVSAKAHGGGLARTSVKAALLGGPLLGGLLAASTVATNRPALGAQDAFVLWLYFSIVAAAALFALDLIAAVLASAWAARRGARSTDALRAGLIVAVPVLAYLVAIWGRERARSTLVLDVLFLAAALRRHRSWLGSLGSSLWRGSWGRPGSSRIEGAAPLPSRLPCSHRSPRRSSSRSRRCSREARARFRRRHSTQGLPGSGSW
jgi:hypothetical protein